MTFRDVRTPSAIAINLALAACSSSRDTFLMPGGPVAAAQRVEFFHIIGWTMIAILPVFVLVPLLLWRYRYRNEKARYTPDECKELKLTYGSPFRIGVRFTRDGFAEVLEEEIYLGEIPVMIGGGEFIINGAERVVVSQLHRSPGEDGITAELIRAALPWLITWILLVWKWTVACAHVAQTWKDGIIITLFTVI